MVFAKLFSTFMFNIYNKYFVKNTKAIHKYKILTSYLLFLFFINLYIMEDNIEIFEEPQENKNINQRPKFLTVLCILSWVNIAFALIGSVMNSFTSEQDQQAVIDQQIAMYSELDMPIIKDDLIEYMNVKGKNLRSETLINLILMLVEGLAVYLMFILYKNGFWLYTGVQACILGALYINSPGDNYFTTISIAISGFIIITFEVLYALNLKHMKD